MTGWIDETGTNADWMRLKWQFPPYKSKAFIDELEEIGMSLEQFKTLSVYAAAVRSGLIVDDEWTGREFKLGNPFIDTGYTLEEQFSLRIAELFHVISAELSRAQADAARALTKLETGEYLLNFLRDLATDTVILNEIEIDPAADISGLDGIVSVNQQEAWGSVLLNYSASFISAAVEHRFPQIWVKRGARAVYYPKRRLIVVPGVYNTHFSLLAHATAHYLETLGHIAGITSILRNQYAYSGTLHMVRNGLFALRGPWVDPMDGAVRGHANDTMEGWYSEGREFSNGEINSLFDDKHTEYFAMIAQRVASGDPMVLADVWSKHPAQLLLYMTIAAGNFMEQPNAV